jgi:hypothetical protein
MTSGCMHMNMVEVAFVHTGVYKRAARVPIEVLLARRTCSRKGSLQWRFLAAMSFVFPWQAAARPRSAV